MSPEELKVAVNAMGLPLSQDQIGALVKAVDMDG